MGVAHLGPSRPRSEWIEATFHQPVAAGSDMHRNVGAIIGLRNYASHRNRQLEGDPAFACNSMEVVVGDSWPADHSALYILDLSRLHLIWKSRSVAVASVCLGRLVGSHVQLQHSGRSAL